MKKLKPISTLPSPVREESLSTGRSSVGKLPNLPSEIISAAASPVKLSTLGDIPLSKGEGRALCFDLENRPLAYWYDGQTTSQITAFGWKWADEPDVRTMLLCADGSYVNDLGSKLSSELTHRSFRDELVKADVTYGHNIRRHDLSMFQAWLLRLQLKPLPALLTSDTLRDIPKRNGLSASLENLASMYGLEGDKLKMTQPMWEKANQLHPDGIELARERVVADVLLQERLRAKLLELNILGPPRTWNP